MKTRLKPYDPRRYSPAPWPPRIGELVILLDEPRGYCAELIVTCEGYASVVLLDDEDRTLRRYPINSLISTGKRPADLVSMYLPDPLSFDQAVENERGNIDFTKLKRPKAKGGVTKKRKKKELHAKTKKELTGDQKDFFARLIRERLKELKGDKDGEKN